MSAGFLQSDLDFAEWLGQTQARVTPAVLRREAWAPPADETHRRDYDNQTEHLRALIHTKENPTP